ncbi:MAG: hypothetical protein C0508_02685 [Cyanobacteria bacterium PR.023]|nr:hypothetical protein [Cyanobacteria bacterium PR.023]
MTMERRGENAEQTHSKTALQANDQVGKTMGNEVNETQHNNPRSDFRGGQDSAAAHLPNVELTDSSKVGGKPDQRLQLISDSNAKPEERLAAARELAKEGISKIELQNDKGEKQSLRLETSKAGARDLVSIHSADGSGKEKPLLKGVANSDGSIERQKDSKGRFVDWHGSGKEISPSLADATPRIHSRHSKAGEQPSGVTTVQEADAKPEKTERKVETKVEAKPGEKPADKPEGKTEAKPEAKPDAKVESPSTIDPHKIMDAAALRAGHPVGKLVKTEDGLYMRAKFDVDADGHPNVKKIDPKHGSLRTTLRYSEGNGSVNADAVPYVVLPKGQFKEHGVKVGDLAIVRNKENGALTVAVFGDVGPRHKRGEGSMALARELGLNPSPTHGGTQSRNIEYLAIPGSGGDKARNQTDLLAKINNAKQKLGLRG